MRDGEAGMILRTEARRWARDGTPMVVGAMAVILSVFLTFLAVAVAASGTAAGSAGVHIDTDDVLTSRSTSADLASLAQSTVTLLVPLVAVVVGAHFAGSEMTSGALLHVAVAARQLRLVFAVRAASLVLIAGAVGALTALAAIGSANISASSADLAGLAVGDAAGPTVTASVATAVVIALLTFALACLTRRSVVVLIVVLAYLIVIEPVIAGAIGDGSVWLPRSSLAGLLDVDADPLHALPSALAAVSLTAIAVVRLRRDRAA